MSIPYRSDLGNVKELPETEYSAHQGFHCKGVPGKSSVIDVDLSGRHSEQRKRHECAYQ
jgi:hypothetical protein